MTDQLNSTSREETHDSSIIEPSSETPTAKTFANPLLDDDPVDAPLPVYEEIQAVGLDTTDSFSQNPYKEAPVTAEKESIDEAEANEQEPDTTDSEEVTDKPLAKYSEFVKYSSAMTPFVPFAVIAFIASIAAQFPHFLIGLMDPNELAKLPQFMLNHMPMIVSVGLYLLTAAMLFVGVKQILNGKIVVYESYIKFTKGIVEAEKIHFNEPLSIEIHKAPFSIFFDIGHLEITTPQKEIILKNAPSPFGIKEFINARVSEFKKKQKNI